MRIGLDVTQAVKERGRGIARYIREVVPRLADPGLGLDLTLCIRGERWFRRRLAAGLAPRAARSWMPLPFWMNCRGIELFHSFGNHLPAVSRVPRTFTVHDFRALDWPARPGMGGGRLRRNIARADGIVCLTQHGMDRLLHHYPAFGTERLAVVPHGVDHARFRPHDLQAARAAAGRYGLTAPFVIQLGSWFPHKNLELSIRAFARSRARTEGYRLAFVGGDASAQYAAELADLARREGVRDAISWIEHVPADDLPALLSAASVLLHPSRYEGFALPILEAMAVGLPGVVSDSSCLPEVSGGAWPVAGQEDADGFAAGLDAMALDGPRRADAIRAGLARAAGFTWGNTARATSAFFQRVMRARRHTAG